MRMAEEEEEEGEGEGEGEVGEVRHYVPPRDWVEEGGYKRLLVMRLRWLVIFSSVSWSERH